MRYHPWGGTRYTYGTTPTDRQFTGQINDVEIGLYFYNARYYDPALGRFIQADSIVPGAASGSGGGAATLGYDSSMRLTPLTVNLGEFAAQVNAENREVLQFGAFFQWDSKTRQEHNVPMGPGNPQALNRYAYCLNNPLRYVDPTEHSAWAIAVRMNWEAWGKYKSELENLQGEAAKRGRDVGVIVGIVAGSASAAFSGANAVIAVGVGIFVGYLADRVAGGAKAEGLEMFYNWVSAAERQIGNQDFTLVLLVEGGFTRVHILYGPDDTLYQPYGEESVYFWIGNNGASDTIFEILNQPCDGAEILFQWE